MVAIVNDVLNLLLLRRSLPRRPRRHTSRHPNRSPRNAVPFTPHVLALALVPAARAKLATALSTSAKHLRRLVNPINESTGRTCTRISAIRRSPPRGRASLRVDNNTRRSALLVHFHGAEVGDESRPAGHRVVKQCGDQRIGGERIHTAGNGHDRDVVLFVSDSCMARQVGKRKRRQPSTLRMSVATSTVSGLRPVRQASIVETSRTSLIRPLTEAFRRR